MNFFAHCSSGVIAWFPRDDRLKGEELVELDDGSNGSTCSRLDGSEAVTVFGPSMSRRLMRFRVRSKSICVVPLDVVCDPWINMRGLGGRDACSFRNLMSAYCVVESSGLVVVSMSCEAESLAWATPQYLGRSIDVRREMASSGFWLRTGNDGVLEVVIEGKDIEGMGGLITS